MRGKGHNLISVLFVQRITPAYAGKRPIIIAERISFRDHPRLCGEKYFYMNEENREKGSPPPMRGKDDLWNERFQRQGITPAYAGKRLIIYIMCEQAGDHPRLCGEKNLPHTRF